MSSCTSLSLTANSLYTVIVGLFFISILYTCVIIYHRSLKEKLSGTAKSLQIIFLISSLITVGYYPCIRWGYPLNPCIIESKYYTILLAFFNMCYGVQCTALTLLFYITMVRVFRGTPFSISNCAQNIYQIIFTFSGMGIISMGIIISVGAEWFLIASGLLLIYIITMISLTILFIRKLMVVYGQASRSHNDNSRVVLDTEKDNANHKALMAPITKLTILISLSLLMSLLQIVMISIRVVHLSELTGFMVHTSGVIDVYTNFVNAMLANKIFDDYYNKICGPLDSKCRTCCMNRFQSGQIKREKRLASVISDTRDHTLSPDHETTHTTKTMDIHNPSLPPSPVPDADSENVNAKKTPSLSPAPVHVEPPVNHLEVVTVKGSSDVNGEISENTNGISEFELSVSTQQFNNMAIIH